MYYFDNYQDEIDYEYNLNYVPEHWNNAPKLHLGLG